MSIYDNNPPCSSIQLEDTNTATEPINLVYPKAIGFILGFKFFERFSVHSIKTLLVLYLTTQLGFSAHSATIVYHTHGMLIFLMGIFGAIVADSWLGKFHTILYSHILTTIGTILFVLTAVTQLQVPFRSELTIFTLIVLSFGNGCAKPCLTALGSDQFQHPDQSPLIQQFFSKFYFTLKLSAVASSLTAPILRSDIPSISAANGYLLAFGVGLVMCTIGLAIYVAGTPFYTKVQVTENMIVQVAKCIGSGIKGKCLSSGPKESHWLDYALHKHNPKIVQDAKIMLNIIVMLIPLPMFWALNEQTASMIPLQAARMNGDLGFYTIKPDQLQLVMQILVMALIPFCEIALYPFLALFGIVTVFQRIAFGGCVSICAFITAGILETQIAAAANPLPLIWILPQYVMLALVEAIVGVLTMVFANITAPKSLQTVVQASFLATHGLGNIYDIAIIGAFSFLKQAHLFFLFAGLMCANTFFFIVLAMRYKTIVSTENTTT